MQLIVISRATTTTTKAVAAAATATAAAVFWVLAKIENEIIVQRKRMHARAHSPQSRNYFAVYFHMTLWHDPMFFLVRLCQRIVHMKIQYTQEE